MAGAPKAAAHWQPLLRPGLVTQRPPHTYSTQPVTSGTLGKAQLWVGLGSLAQHTLIGFIF